MAEKPRTIPEVLLSLSDEELARAQPLSEGTVRAAVEKGRESRKAAVAAAVHPVVNVKVRIR